MIYVRYRLQLEKCRDTPSETAPGVHRLVLCNVLLAKVYCHYSLFDMYFLAKNDQ